MALINSLIQEGWLKTPQIIEAFKKIKRVDFLPENIKDLAELNEALPIGLGQTISQPLVVAFMIELLDPKPGEKILDIGSGSGWTTALLSELVGEEPARNASHSDAGGPARNASHSDAGGGKVIAIEIIPELTEFGKKNVAKYNFIERGIAEFICTDGSKGFPNISSRPEFAEGFDKILASASAEKLPKAWKDQLKESGRIVTPIGSSIWLFIKKSEKEFEEKEYPGFAFVPLVSGNK